MKLYASVSSPYARKARIAAMEKGLMPNIEVIMTSPFESNSKSEELKRLNPLFKIPVLLIDDGMTLYDSNVICEYLDEIGHGNSLIPRQFDRRMVCLKQVALADGILDAAFSIVMELRRPVDKRSDDWISRWSQNIRRAAPALQTAPVEFLDLAAISAACAIDYVCFRLLALDLLPQSLIAWRAEFAGIQSLLATAPREA